MQPLRPVCQDMFQGTAHMGLRTDEFGVRRERTGSGHGEGGRLCVLGEEKGMSGVQGVGSSRAGPAHRVWAGMRGEGHRAARGLKTGAGTAGEKTLFFQYFTVWSGRLNGEGFPPPAGNATSLLGNGSLSSS